MNESGSQDLRVKAQTNFGVFFFGQSELLLTEKTKKHIKTIRPANINNNSSEVRLISQLGRSMGNKIYNSKNSYTWMTYPLSSLATTSKVENSWEIVASTFNQIQPTIGGPVLHITFHSEWLFTYHCRSKFLEPIFNDSGNSNNVSLATIV